MADLESHDDGLEFVGQRTREQRDEEGRRRAIEVNIVSMSRRDALAQTEHQA